MKKAKEQHRRLQASPARASGDGSMATMSRSRFRMEEMTLWMLLRECFTRSEVDDGIIAVKTCHSGRCSPVFQVAQARDPGLGVVELCVGDEAKGRKIHGEYLGFWEFLKEDGPRHFCSAQPSFLISAPPLFVLGYLCIFYTTPIFASPVPIFVLDLFVVIVCSPSMFHYTLPMNTVYTDRFIDFTTHLCFTLILGLLYILLAALLMNTLHLLHAPHILLIYPHIFVFHFYLS